jgi:AcrR family transcriptional regulator
MTNIDGLHMHNGHVPPREPTRTRIRSAARRVVARKGFNATVEEIAEEARLSQRTVFRQYKSRDALIVDAVKDMFEACGERPIVGLPTAHDDLDGWIEGLATTIHTRNTEIIGQAFWDIHSRHKSSTLEQICALREKYRVKGVRHLADVAWEASGGNGPTPDELTWVIGLNFSVFTTQALTIDFGLTPTQIGKLTADLVKSALRRAVDDNAELPIEAV